MSGPVTVVCPNGHASVDRDQCSVCGAWITDASASSGGLRPPVASTPTVVPNPTPGRAVQMGGGGQCSNCSSELDAGARFCEVCGYDPATGSMPSAPVAQPIVPPSLTSTLSPSPPVSLSPSLSSPASVSAGQPAPSRAPAASQLLAVVTADRPYYDSQQVGDVQFPVGAPARVIELPGTPVTIGRRSRSLGTDPAVDLAIPPEDPAVSHTHASLLPGDDGTWSLVDHGSTNGTFLNESPEPLPANVPRTVRPGDRIYVGAWTRISLELRPGR